MANQPITEKELGRMAKLATKNRAVTVPSLSEFLGITQERAKTLLERARRRVVNRKTKPFAWLPRGAKSK